jgi:hypothetical protein
MDGMIHISYSYAFGTGKKSIKHIVIDPAKL